MLFGEKIEKYAEKMTPAAHAYISAGLKSLSHGVSRDFCHTQNHSRKHPVYENLTKSAAS